MTSTPLAVSYWQKTSAGSYRSCFTWLPREC